MLGVSRPIYVNVDSPIRLNLGFPYFDFLGGYQWSKKHPVCMWVSFCCTDIDSTFVNVNFSKFVSSPLIPQQGGRVRIWRVIWRANSFASHPSLIKSNCADCAGKVIYKEGLNNVIGTISGWSSEEVDSGIRAGHVFAHGLKICKTWQSAAGVQRRFILVLNQVMYLQNLTVSS